MRTFDDDDDDTGTDPVAGSEASGDKTAKLPMEFTPHNNFFANLHKLFNNPIDLANKKPEDLLKDLKEYSLAIAITDQVKNVNSQSVYVSYLINIVEHYPQYLPQAIEAFKKCINEQGDFNNQQFEKMLKAPGFGPNNLHRLNRWFAESGLGLPTKSFTIPSDDAFIDTKEFKNLSALANYIKQQVAKTKLTELAVIKKLLTEEPSKNPALEKIFTNIKKLSTGEPSKNPSLKKIFTNADLEKLNTFSDTDFDLSHFLTEKVAKNVTLINKEPVSNIQTAKNGVRSGVGIIAWTVWHAIPLAMVSPGVIVLGSGVALNNMKNYNGRPYVPGSSWGGWKDVWKEVEAQKNKDEELAESVTRLYKIISEEYVPLSKVFKNADDLKGSELTKIDPSKLEEARKDQRLASYLDKVPGAYNLDDKGKATPNDNANIIVETALKYDQPLLDLREKLEASHHNTAKPSIDIFKEYLATLDPKIRQELADKFPIEKIADDKSKAAGADKEVDADKPSDKGDPSIEYKLLTHPAFVAELLKFREFHKQEEIFQKLNNDANRKKHIVNLISSPEPHSEFVNLCKQQLGLTDNLSKATIEAAIDNKYPNDPSKGNTLAKFVDDVKALNDLPSLIYALKDFVNPDTEIDKAGFNAALDQFKGSLQKDPKYAKHLEVFEKALAKLAPELKGTANPSEAGSEPDKNAKINKDIMDKLFHEYYDELKKQGLPQESVKNALGGNNFKYDQDFDPNTFVSLYDAYAHYIAAEGGLGLGLDSLLDWMIKNMINLIFLFGEHATVFLIYQKARSDAREMTRNAMVAYNKAKIELHMGLNELKNNINDSILEKKEKEELNKTIQELDKYLKKSNPTAQETSEFDKKLNELYKNKNFTVDQKNFLKDKIKSFADAKQGRIVADATIVHRAQQIMVNMQKAGTISWVMSKTISNNHKLLLTLGAAGDHLINKAPKNGTPFVPQQAAGAKISNGNEPTNDPAKAKITNSSTPPPVKTTVGVTTGPTTPPASGATPPSDPDTRSSGYKMT